MQELVNNYIKEIKTYKKEIKEELELLKRVADKRYEIQVTHLKPIICNEYNQDFGGRELLSNKFNNFLDLRNI